jgi:flagellar M-ring protein FliF
VNPRVGQGMARARSLMAGFTPGQRGVILVAVAALVLGVVALTRWVAQPSWTPLYSQLSGTDASAVVTQLQADNVPYQLADGGGTVLVPQSQVYDLRVSLAGKNLPADDAGSGWSILDKQGLTATDFQQNVAYQRAMETELGKTLGAMTGVKSAVVHLAIPKRDIFSTTTDRPTAAVLLSLTPGTTLSRTQVQSVTHMVGGSVPNLDPADVTVTDQKGTLLSSRNAGAAGAADRASEADNQTALFEDRQAGKLQAMLDQVLGAGHAVVKVTAQLSFDTKSTTSEHFVAPSPSLPPLSQSTSVETYGAGAAGAGGVLGVPTPSAVAGANGSGGYGKSQSTVNNAIGKEVTNEQAAPGSIQRLNVSVVLDQTTTKSADVNKVLKLVTTAAGIDATRGDAIQVDQLPFDTTTSVAAAKDLASAQKDAQLAQYIDLGKKAGLVILAIVGLVIFLKRRPSDDEPNINVTASDLPGVLMPSRIEAIGAGRATLPYEDQQSPRSITAQSEPAIERERLRDEISGLVDSQPEEMAQLVQGWLGDRG